LVIAMTVGAVLAFSSSWRGVFPVRLGQIALFVSMTPAVVGLAQGLYALARAERGLRVVADVVDGARPPEKGSQPPPGTDAPVALDAVSFRYDGGPKGADALRAI